MRPLKASELFGAGGAAGGDAGQEQTDAAPGADAALEVDATETDGDGPATDAPVSGCLPACAADQFCDELAGRCASRTGVGMLSGVVRDKCGGGSLDALVGIAGRHQCTFARKGSYFFTQLPLGMLKLAAAKEGYQPYAATVVIAPGGIVHDVELVRAGGGLDGCGVAPPAEVACSCTDPGCVP